VIHIPIDKGDNNPLESKLLNRVKITLRATNTVSNTTGNFNEFENEIAQPLVRPWVQVVNVKNDSLKNIAKDNKPWGFFLAQEQATDVGFEPDNNWDDIDIEFVDDEPTHGYLTKSPRFVVIQRSRPEAYKKNSYGNWRYEGLYFGDSANSASTNYHELIKGLSSDDQKSWRSITRYLLMFVDEKNQPLHSKPLQLKLKGAGGYAIGQAIVDTYVNFEKSYFASIKKPHSIISPAGRARIVIDLKLGLEKPGANSPQIVVETLSTPSVALGKFQEVDSKGKTVKHFGVSLDSMLVSASTSFGAQLRDLHQDNLEFALPGGKKAQAIVNTVDDELETVDDENADLMPF